MINPFFCHFLSFLFHAESFDTAAIAKDSSQQQQVLSGSQLIIGSFHCFAS
jgi:hypothetical protein